jgi:hypothetical protein
VSVDNGTTWTPAETVGPGSSSDPNTNPGWILASWSFASLGLTPTSTVRVRFVADDATGAIVEAAIDDFAIDGASCTGAVCRPDYNTDGVVTVQDIFDFLNGWFVSAPSADYNTDGVVTVQDIFDFLNGWFAGC